MLGVAWRVDDVGANTDAAAIDDAGDERHGNAGSGERDDGVRP